MGVVYRAHDRNLGREVAIKMLPIAFALDPDRLTRLRREARLLASLTHPNIGTVHGLEEYDGTTCLVLELVDGETLAARLDRAGPFPVSEALDICRQVADALAAAHHKGIVHRPDARVLPTVFVVEPNAAFFQHNEHHARLRQA
jgi:eukaryotic-like serine/threonine-protein kinase